MKKEDRYYARLYMKSGNVIELSDLKELSAKDNGCNEITHLKWAHHDDYKGFKLLSTSINLTQIEAITFLAT